jgi:glucosamine-phosphate N-acetyltransferase
MSLIIIREMEYEDLDHGFLEVYDSLVPARIDKYTANQILTSIKSNPFHKVFVAVVVEDDVGKEEKKEKNKVLGTTTLIVEPKFIAGGARVGHIEDVAVRPGYQGMSIGSRLVKHVTEYAKNKMGCIKIVLDCAEQTMPFYQKLGYTYQDICMKIE